MKKTTKAGVGLSLMDGREREELLALRLAQEEWTDLQIAEALRLEVRTAQRRVAAGKRRVQAMWGTLWHQMRHPVLSLVEQAVVAHREGMAFLIREGVLQVLREQTFWRGVPRRPRGPRNTMNHTD